MTVQVNLQSVCMRFGRPKKLKTLPITLEPVSIKNTKKLTKRQIEDLFFDNYTDCQKMGAVPQGAFAALKFQEMMEHQVLSIKPKREEGNNFGSSQNGAYSKTPFEERELTPMKYSSKLMNSIWGLYNRYSVHNFKKNTDADGNMLTAALGNVLLSSTSPAATSSQSVAKVVVKSHVG